jgi:Integrase core domain
MATSMVLDAIEQAIWTRQRECVLDLKDVVHHTDRGSQYTSIRFTERLAEAGIQPSVGAVGSSYDNALAETINGLYKTELIKPRKPWRTIEEVELATAEWVHWFNHRRLYEYCGDIPPAALEAAYYAQRRSQPPAESSNQKVSELTGAVQPNDAAVTVTVTVAVAVALTSFSSVDDGLGKELRVLLAHSMRNGPHKLPRPGGMTRLDPGR